jgi:hypothetical protein
MFRKTLKLLNPFIWCINYFNYISHLHMWAERQHAANEYGNGREVEYELYNLDKDIKYF